MVLLCPFLGAACLWDYSYRRIPNFLQLLLWGVGLIFCFITESWKGLFLYNLISFAVIVSLYPFFALGLLGAGDVKLLGLAAGFFRGTSILLFLLITFICAALTGVIDVAFRKKRKLFKGFGKEYVILSGPILFSAVLHWGGMY